MAGAPQGNTNAAKGKRWSNAIDTALANRSKSDAQAALVELAEKLILAAEGGDAWALKELGDRIDGKAAQSVTLSGDEDAPLVTRIERVIQNIKD